jgi:hypothetical protein
MQVSFQLPKKRHVFSELIMYLSTSGFERFSVLIPLSNSSRQAFHVMPRHVYNFFYFAFILSLLDSWVSQASARDVPHKKGSALTLVVDFFSLNK